MGGILSPHVYYFLRREVLLVTFSLVLVANTSVSAQEIQTLVLGFSRTVIESATINRTGGQLAFKAPDEVYIHVQDPIEQWMVFYTNKILIYYPKDRTAFELASGYSSNVPFFEAFIGSIKEDYGLSDLGFSIADHKIKNDTLTTMWRPDERVSRLIGNFILSYYDNKIIFTEAKDTAGKTITKVYYSNHIDYKNRYFPLDVKIFSYQSNGMTIENINYKNPIFNAELPDVIKNFKVPDDVEIKKVEF